MKQLGIPILVLGAVLLSVSPAARSEQPQKTTHSTQEERVKNLESRMDAAEKATSAAGMEKDYITRVQKQYESYYQRVLNTQMWTLAIMGLILTLVFVLVARFSLRLVDEHIKTGTAGATVQMRNEYARALAKEAQKLWDSNAADIKKLKETLTTHVAELEQNLKERSEFQMQFVQALATAVDDRQGDSLATFRSALGIYKSGKSRNLIAAKFGATAVRSLLESVRKAHGESYAEQTRRELRDPLYNDLDEELALAALESPWLAPIVHERAPTPKAPPAPAEAVAERPATTVPPPFSGEDAPLDEESDSCRLITT